MMTVNRTYMGLSTSLYLYCLNNHLVWLWQSERHSTYHILSVLWCYS